MTYTEHLKQQLHEVELAIARAERQFDSGDVPGKVEALNHLRKLRARHEQLAERIEAAAGTGSENWSALRESFQEEADALRDSVKAWMDRVG